MYKIIFIPKSQLKFYGIELVFFLTERELNNSADFPSPPPFVGGFLAPPVISRLGQNRLFRYGVGARGLGGVGGGDGIGVVELLHSHAQWLGLVQLVNWTAQYRK